MWYDTLKRNAKSFVVKRDIFYGLSMYVEFWQRVATRSNIIGLFFVIFIFCYIWCMNIHILAFSFWYRCCWWLWAHDISRIRVAVLWIMINQTFLGGYIISFFDYNRPTWIQGVIAEQVFKFQYVREDVHIHIVTKNIFILFSEWLFAWQWKHVRFGT